MKLFVFLLTIVLPWTAFAQSSSSNFQIFIDSVGSGGGSTSGSSFELENTVGAQGPGIIESPNFRTSGGFAGIESEPAIGFTLLDNSIDFGSFSQNDTNAGTLSFIAYTSADAGYRIQVFGDTLTNENNETIDAMSPTGETIQVGTEQFGLNLVQNTVPAVGIYPNGGSGQAAQYYDTPNTFAFENGAIVATAPSYSDETTYTASVITNISPLTHDGTYSTVLTFSLVAEF